MIRTEPYDQMDRLQPSDDRYKIEGEELWLQGSAEHVLGSMHAGEIFDAKQLPLRYLGFATSFRKEAGTYGKDMEGLIRMHQFDKLEMESFTEAKDRDLSKNTLTSNKAKILSLLMKKRSSCSSAPWAVWRDTRSLIDGVEPDWLTRLRVLPQRKIFLVGAHTLSDVDYERIRAAHILIVVILAAGHSMSWENPGGFAAVLAAFMDTDR